MTSFKYRFAWHRTLEFLIFFIRDTLDLQIVIATRNRLLHKNGALDIPLVQGPKTRHPILGVAARKLDIVEEYLARPAGLTAEFRAEMDTCGSDAWTRLRTREGLVHLLRVAFGLAAMAAAV